MLSAARLYACIASSLMRAKKNYKSVQNKNANDIRLFWMAVVLLVLSRLKSSASHGDGRRVTSRTNPSRTRRLLAPACKVALMPKWRCFEVGDRHKFINHPQILPLSCLTRLRKCVCRRGRHINHSTPRSRFRGKKVIGKMQGLDLGVLYRVRDVCIWINKEQGSCSGINEEHKGCEAIKGSGRCGLYDSVIELVKSIHAPPPNPPVCSETKQFIFKWSPFAVRYFCSTRFWAMPFPLRSFRAPYWR